VLQSWRAPSTCRLGGSTGKQLLESVVQLNNPPHTNNTPVCASVLPQAMLLMDVHVHLSGCEVIGLLGGTWTPGERLLRITAAYPCR
jgi:hypothetical protein